MERALALEGLRLALGEHDDLPTSEELQSLMADVEVGLFIQRPAVPESLLRTAWYLHGIASAVGAAALYTPERQRRAFQISAHLFDLALADPGLSRLERFRLAFGAQVGYRRSELEPNAMAMFARLRGEISLDRPLSERLDSIALEAGVALLGFDSRYLFPLLRRLREEFEALRRQVDLPSLRETLFGPAWGVVNGADALLRYLALGESQSLERARDLLGAAARAEGDVSDLDARWVAAHLDRIAGDAATSSIWAAMPPDLPAAAKRALTLTSPPVLTLWRPQMDLLTRGDGPNPLSRDAKRIVLSVPTSAGKTLIAQMLMVTHLATELTSVCYVAPMRSLGREVRAAMRGRMAVLRRELGRDLPDYADFGFSQEDLDNVGVDVMTPERLMHLVRRDANFVLDRYSLFIFDEAHMLAERGRGPLLEQLLSFLHWRTASTYHRLVLLSAAIGNRGQIMTWLDPAGSGVPFSSDWRGPRRLHAIYNTEVENWTAPLRTETVRSPRFPVRKVFELAGIVRLRPAEESRIATLQFVEPVGVLAMRETTNGVRDPNGRERDHSTPAYRTAARVAAAVGHAGPVLVVMSSRIMARQMARAIAELAHRRPGTRQLTELVRTRLGSQHPLVEVLPHGIAFHHGGLPTDVLETLEDALREGVIDCVVATSTLTEGVNLPVRTVVIAETRYEGQPTEVQLRGARLVNAMGRAGRATKESEGWIVLCRQAAVRRADFELLRPGDEELEVRSRLATADALQELAEFEEVIRAAEDAAFQHAGEEVRSFIAFVWFVLVAEEELGRVGERADYVAALLSTLGFAQLDDATRARWLAVAKRVREDYEAVESSQRRRWSRAGTSVASARALDLMSQRLALRVEDAPADADLSSANAALELLAEEHVLTELLALPEVPRAWAFRRYPSAAADIAVDPDVALREWLTGVDVATTAERLLAGVTEADFRLEQMVDAVTEHFEHYLAWTLGVIVALVNQALESRGLDRPLCPDLPLYVRYGVDSDLAVALALGGVRSRRLIHVVAGQATDEAGEIQIEDWLAGMSISAWRERFEAQAPELLDLLEFTRTKRGGILPDFLETGSARVTVETVVDVLEPTAVTVREIPGDPTPARLGAIDEWGQLLAAVPPSSHSEVLAVISTGLGFTASLVDDELTLSLLD